MMDAMEAHVQGSAGVKSPFEDDQDLLDVWDSDFASIQETLRGVEVDSWISSNCLADTSPSGSAARSNLVIRNDKLLTDTLASAALNNNNINNNSIDILNNNNNNSNSSNNCHSSTSHTVVSHNGVSNGHGHDCGKGMVVSSATMSSSNLHSHGLANILDTSSISPMLMMAKTEQPNYSPFASLLHESHYGESDGDSLPESPISMDDVTDMEKECYPCLPLRSVVSADYSAFSPSHVSPCTASPASSSPSSSSSSSMSSDEAPLQWKPDCVVIKEEPNSRSSSPVQKDSSSLQRLLSPPFSYVVKNEKDVKMTTIYRHAPPTSQPTPARSTAIYFSTSAKKQKIFTESKLVNIKIDPESLSCNLKSLEDKIRLSSPVKSSSSIKPSGATKVVYSPSTGSSSASSSMCTSSSTRNPIQTSLISYQPKGATGELCLTEEEKRTLISEGYPVPQRLPLTKAEEKSLKKIRRKIKNKISAQESRRKKKEYMDNLEKRMDFLNQELSSYKQRCSYLESQNAALQAKLMKLQAQMVQAHN